MTKFNVVKERNFKTLEMYVPVVARVHGGSHPEFHTVHKLFNELKENLQETNRNSQELQGIFKQLREVSDDYTVPADVCESYEAVYRMLQELDEAYHA